MKIFSNIKGGVPNPLTATGAIIVGGTAGAQTELLIGAEGQVAVVTTGALVYTTPTKAMVGLGNVDNTADANKAIDGGVW